MPSYVVKSPTLPEVVVTVYDYTFALNTATDIAHAIARRNPHHEVQVIDASTTSAAKPRIVRRCYATYVERLEVIPRAKPAALVPRPSPFKVNPRTRKPAGEKVTK